MMAKKAIKQVIDFDATVEAVVILVVNEPLTPPPLLWSTVGEGKTTFYEQLAKALKMEFYQLPASHIDPAIIHGIPVAQIDKQVTSFLPPEFIAADRTFLLIDEINTAPESVVAGVMEAIRTRRIGRKVYEDLKVVLAANPARVAAGGFSLPIPLRNRVIHIDWLLPLEHFRLVTSVPPFDRQPTIFPENFPIASKDDVRRLWAKASGIVDAFLTRFPHLLHEEISENGIEEERNAFGSPRTWDYVKVILAVFWAVKATPAAISVAVLGAVGQAAYDFFAFLSSQDVPLPSEVLSNPHLLATLSPDALYSTLFALLSHLAQHPSDADRFINVVNFFIEKKKHDYAMLLIDSFLKMAKSNHNLVVSLPGLETIDLDILMKAKQIAQKLGGEVRGKEGKK